MSRTPWCEMLVCLGLEWKDSMSEWHKFLYSTRYNSYWYTKCCNNNINTSVVHESGKNDLLDSKLISCAYIQLKPRHDLVSAQTSNVCITCHAPLNAIAYIVCVKQFVMSLPAISLGDWFSVNGKGFPHAQRGFRMHIANDTYHIHTYKHTNVPMYLRLQHNVSALRCRDKNPCRQKPMQGII